jgi:branched-chain amino acid aminotransferase
MIKTVIVWKKTNQNGLEKLSFEPGKEPQTLDQASTLIPPGAYTTFRTYNKTHALHFCAHLARLEESGRIAHCQLKLNGDSLRQGLRRALSETIWKECRVRVTVNLESTQGEYYLFIEELQIPTPLQYGEGVRVEVIRAQRENPEAKLSSFLPVARDLRKKVGKSAYELIMMGDKGVLLEGLSSNFFAVLNGTLKTAGAGVLEGITRKYVLKVAEIIGVPVSFNPVRMDEVPNLQEAFITSSSRGILPVVQIDRIVIGDGKPGKITNDLSGEFKRSLTMNLEPI